MTLCCRVFALAILCVALSVPSASAEQRVSGIVQDASDYPIQGAAVRLMPLNDGECFSQCKTDAEGVFTFEKVIEGEYDLVFDASGYVREVISKAVVEPGKPLQIGPVRLNRGLSFAGVITDSVTSKPIKGADVWASVSWLSTESTKPERLVFHTTTNASGEYEIWGMAPAKFFDLVVDATNCAHEYSWKLLPGQRDLSYALRPGASVSGIVTAGKNEPVGNVEVFLRRIDDVRQRHDFKVNTVSFLGETLTQSYVKALSLESHPMLGKESVKTEADGTFRFSGIAPGRYSLAGRLGDQIARCDLIPGRLQLSVGQEVSGLRFQLQPGGSISGLVLEETGETTLAGVKVSVIPLKVDGSPDPQETTTDASGRFSVGGLEIGGYLITASTDHYSMDGTDFEENCVAINQITSVTTNIRLKPNIGITGRVVDAAGSPIAGATVEIGIYRTEVLPRGFDYDLYEVYGYSRFSSMIEQDSIAKYLAEADASGHFSFDDLPSQESIGLQVSASGYSTASEYVNPSKERHVEIVLYQGGTMQGRVYLDSELVADATVTIHQERDYGEDATNASRTDQNGNFTFVNLRQGFYYVHAHTDTAISEPEKIFVEFGKQTEDIEIHLQPGNAIRGWVLCRDTQPAQGVQGVTITVTCNGVVRTGVSLPDGTFSVENVLNGEVYVQMATPTGYLSEDSFSGWRMRFWGGDAEGVEFVLSQAAKVSGKVLDPQGGLVSKATVSLSGSYRYSSCKAAVQDGYYTLENCPAGECEVSASSDGFAPTTSPEFKLEPGEHKENVDIQLKVGASVSGTVKDSTGNPIFGATVSVHRGYGITYKSTTTDRSGFYQLENVPPGIVQVGVTSPQWLALDDSSESLTLEDGQILQNMDFCLQSSAEDDEDEEDEQTEEDEEDETELVSIKGIVLDENERPLSGISLTANGEDSSARYAYARSDEHGRFEFKDLKPGTYQIAISRYSRESMELDSPVTSEAPKDDLVLRMQTSGGITGIIRRGTDQTPVTRFKIHSWKGVQEAYSGMYATDCYSPRGEFKLENLPPGDYSISVQVQGLADKTVQGIRVASGKITEGVVIEVGDGCSVFGYVRSGAEGAQPIAGVVVQTKAEDQYLYATGRTKGNLQKSTTDNQGFFRLEGINPGPATITATLEGFSKAEKRIFLQDGEETGPIEFTLLSGGAIEGTVFDNNNKPIPEANVHASSMLTDIPYRESSRKTDAKGYYKFNSLSPGHYEVSVFLGYGGIGTARATSKKASVREGETTVVNFTPEGALVYGTVTCKGRPVKKSRMFVMPSFSKNHGPSIASCDTNEKGYYQFTAIPPGRWFISSFGCQVGHSCHLTCAQEIEVPESGGVFEINLSYKEVKVSGIVLSGKDASPVAEAEITLLEENTEAYGKFGYKNRYGTTTKKNGTFTVEPVLPERYILHVRATGFGEKTVTVDARDSDVGNVEVILGEFGTLEAAVVDQKTNAPLDAMIYLTGEDDVTVQCPRIYDYDNSSGLLRYTTISPGIYKVTAETWGDKHIPQSLSNVEVRTNETTSIRFALEPAVGDYKILCLDPTKNNEPITDRITASISSAEGIELPLLKPESQTSVVSGSLPEGSYILTVSCPGRVSQDYPLDVPMEGVEIRDSVLLSPE